VAQGQIVSLLAQDRQERRLIGGPLGGRQEAGGQFDVVSRIARSSHARQVRSVEGVERFNRFIGPGGVRQGEREAEEGQRCRQEV